jgi:hypothetical protein
MLIVQFPVEKMFGESYAMANFCGERVSEFSCFCQATEAHAAMKYSLEYEVT